MAANAIQLINGSANPIGVNQQDWQDEQIDTAIRRNYAAGVVFWNGCRDPHGVHLPGHNVAYPRPDLGV